MKREYVDYLKDMLDAIKTMESFVKDMNLEEFENDTKTLFAVIRALEIIGEAAKKIPDAVKNKYKQVPWKDIAGMRNKLIHEYFGVNVKVVWKTIEQDIPSIKPSIEDMVRAET